MTHPSLSPIGQKKINAPYSITSLVFPLICPLSACPGLKGNRKLAEYSILQFSQHSYNLSISKESERYGSSINTIPMLSEISDGFLVVDSHVMRFIFCMFSEKCSALAFDTNAFLGICLHLQTFTVQRGYQSYHVTTRTHPVQRMGTYRVYNIGYLGLHYVS